MSGGCLDCEFAGFLLPVCVLMAFGLLVPRSFIAYQGLPGTKLSFAALSRYAAEYVVLAGDRRSFLRFTKDALENLPRAQF